MKVINTKTHGVLDYLMGILLIVSPWIFGFADGGAAMWIPVILGIGTLLYSLLTNYELGAFKVISMKTHLGIDMIAGIFLAVSPWIFGFADTVYMPHLTLGIIEVLAVIMTKTTLSTNLKNVRQSPAL